MKKNEDSNALKEVWQLKDDAYKAVEGLPLATALHARLTTSIATAAQLGFVATRALNCAEASVKYDVKR
jgi:hypothetical protein